MARSRYAAVVMLGILVFGCAERVRIKSYPPGAKAFLDGEYIGSTPAVTTIPRSQVGKPHNWKVEYRNCDPAEGQLIPRVGGGRVVGYIFTLGFVALFKGPRGFPPVEAALTGGDCETRSEARSERRPSGITVQQIVGDRNRPVGSSEDGVSESERLAERLKTLRDLYNRKLISQEVYEREMQKSVDDLE